MGASTYKWSVELRHEVKGFAKRFVVSSDSWVSAGHGGYKALGAAGYDVSDPAFVIVSVVRGARS